MFVSFKNKKEAECYTLTFKTKNNCAKLINADDPNKKIILLATIHTPLDLRNKLVYSVVKAMLELPEYHLIIKLHPDEKPDFYKVLLKKFKLNATIVSDLSVHPLIDISELAGILSPV